MFGDNDLFHFSSFIFKKITISLKKEELDCIDIDVIGNFEDSPRHR